MLKIGFLGMSKHVFVIVFPLSVLNNKTPKKWPKLSSRDSGEVADQMGSSVSLLFYNSLSYFYLFYIFSKPTGYIQDNHSSVARNTQLSGNPEYTIIRFPGVFTIRISGNIHNPEFWTYLQSGFPYRGPDWHPDDQDNRFVYPLLSLRVSPEGLNEWPESH